MADLVTASSSAPRLSIILPVYNQADHLEQMTAGHLEVLERLGTTYELLLVTNGCRDASPQIAQRLADAHSGVRALDLRGVVDSQGVIILDFSSTGLRRGNYQLVLYGARSQLTGVASFTVQ